MSLEVKSICRVVHNKNYTVINNFICKDNRISYKAKGIWLYAFSRPDDWQFYLSDIINQSTDGRDKVRSGLEELEKYGYLTRERTKNEKGQFVTFSYTFYESPREIQKIFPKSENPKMDNPTLENPPLLSTDIKLNTEPINTESSSSSSSSEETENLPQVPDEIDDACGADDDLENEPDFIWYRKSNGNMEKISQTEIYQHFLKKPYSTKTLKQAIKRFKDVISPVNNPLKYIESICLSIDKQPEKKPSKEQINTEKQERPEKIKEKNITFEEYFRCQNKPNPFRLEKS